MNLIPTPEQIRKQLRVRAHVRQYTEDRHQFTGVVVADLVTNDFAIEALYRIATAHSEREVDNATHNLRAEMHRLMLSWAAFQP